MKASVVRWVAAQLETPCPDGCDNGTVPNTAALVAHEQKLAAARRCEGWNQPRHTARGNYIDIAKSAPPETAPCPGCSGRGLVLTEAGHAAIEFLTRYGIGAES